MATLSEKPAKPAEPIYRFHFFSELLGRKVCAGKIGHKIGKLTDIIVKLAEPYPEAVGLYIEHGWGKPTELVPWDKLVKIDPDAIFVQPTPDGQPYPPFVDQPGWMLLNEHLMGKTILDMDGRQIEVVNDVHLLESGGRVALVHVDTSFNGFLRKMGLRPSMPWWTLFIHPVRVLLRPLWSKDRLISWKYVQPLSLEDAVATDKVSLSIARGQIQELPPEDLADALEELTGTQQQAVFSALDSEKAAETLIEAEPRTQRQLIADLRQERARTILSQMTVAQMADLFSVLPHDDMVGLKALLPEDQRQRVTALMNEREVTAAALMTNQFMAMPADTTVAGALENIRQAQPDPEALSYIYVTSGPDRLLLGVVDLRNLILSDGNLILGDLMASPVVAAEENHLREDLVELFTKYHYRMIPVVDPRDHLLGVVNHKDIMTRPVRN